MDERHDVATTPGSEIDRMHAALNVMRWVAGILVVVVVAQTIILQNISSAGEQTRRSAQASLTSSEDTRESVRRLQTTVDSIVENVIDAEDQGGGIDPARVEEGITAIIHVRDMLCASGIIQCNSIGEPPP